jgi:glycosyltransferase involved in cell wall biosynthesis
MENKMKLLAWSDSPLVDTGFGRVAREVLKSLYATGKYDITHIGINYFGLTPSRDDTSASGIDKRNAFLNYNHIPASIGKSRHIYGNDLLIESLEKNDYDVVWLLQDTFNIVPVADKILELKKRKKFKVVIYFPIDTERFPDWFLDCLKCADEAVCYNEWSRSIVEKKLENRGYSCHVSTIYHGYNPSDFYPISKKERREFRAKFFNGKVGEKDILIVQSDSNSQRKNFYKTLEIVGAVAKKNPRVKLYVNTRVADQDFQLYYLATQCGLKPGENFLYMMNNNKAFLSQDTLNRVYNSADIGISAVLGEGTGLFHYEMMGLNRPMVVSANSAHLEAVKAGACLGIECNSWIVLPNDLSAQRPLVNVRDGISKLEWLIDIVERGDKFLLERYRDAQVEFMKDKTWDIVGHKWVELFDRVEQTDYSGLYADGDVKTDDVFGSIIKSKIEEAKVNYEKKTGKKAPDIKWMD